VVEVKNDKLSPDIRADLARHGQGETPQTAEGRKAVALKRWEQLNPERLSYHVMFADTALHDEGKETVRDFITATVPATSAAT
jgi:type III restriction enzyme